MKNTNQETANSISFPQAIATTQSLMNQMAIGELSEKEITKQITILVNNKQGARGFFVAYLTGELPLADNPSSGVINALKSAPDLVGELLVKNVAMSTAMVVAHRRNNDQDNAQSSQRVSQRSINLIKQLNLDLITGELNQLKTTLATGEGSYQEFLQKWGYDGEQKETIAQEIAGIR